MEQDGIKKKTAPEQEQAEDGMKQKILTVIGAVLCVILFSILVVNITLIIKSYTNTKDVPTIGGYCPLIVLTDSMYPQIQSGDLIICQTVKPEEIKTGDIISFFDPDGNGTSVVTHQVIKVIIENGELYFLTKGIANSIEDRSPVPAKNLVGIYKARIAGVGKVAMFMQTTSGLIICVVIPLLLLLGYDMLRRRSYERDRREDTAALLAELEALKAEKAAKTGTEASQTGADEDSHKV